MSKILLAVATAAVAALGTIAPAEACWDCRRHYYRGETQYVYEPLTNPGYFSGVTLRIVEPLEYRHYRHRRHAKRQHLK